MSINLVADSISKEDIAKLCAWLESDPRLTKDKLTLEIEEKFAKLIGVKHSVFVNSGSSANFMMMSLLKESGVKSIVIPSICWATNLSPAYFLDVNPIICDCNLDDLSIDLKHLEFLLATYKPEALFLVSVLGMSVNIDKVKEICARHKVSIIEDNCESLLTRYQNSNSVMGSDDDVLMSSYSTFYGHHMSTIEGGFITTNDDCLYESLKMMRAHGWSRDLPDANKKVLREEYDISEWEEKYTFYIPGLNFRNTEISAFLGLLQIDKMQENINVRTANANLFYDSVSLTWKPKITPTFSLPLILDSKEQRVELINRLEANQIECRPLIAGNIARQPVFKTCYPHLSFETPNADVVHERGMYIPNHNKLSDDDLKLMIEVVNSVTN